MRAAPSVSSPWPQGERSHRTRRPTRSEVSIPSAAVRASAWRADFSSTPTRPRTSTTVWVHTGRPAGSTTSPSTVISRERALVAATSRRRENGSGRSSGSL